MRAGGAWVVAVLAALAAAACLESEVVVCEDGRVCPAGLICSEANRRCVSQEQIDACVGKQELATCEVAGGGTGECRAGACLFSVCGDGVVEGAETCDGDNLGDDADCIGLGYHDSQPLRCDASCRLDESVCTGGRCGDGTVNGPELCDGMPPAIQCVHLGYHVGALPACTRCAPDTSLCRRIGLDRMPVAATETAHEMSGTGPDDMWLVARLIGPYLGTLFHHDGTAWLPVLDGAQSVWPVGPGDVYATADIDGGGDLVLLHYDGAVWTEVAGGRVEPGQRVRASGPDDIDLLGSVDAGTPSRHFDGRDWRDIEGIPHGLVRDLATVAPGDTWAIIDDVSGGALVRSETSTSWVVIAPPIAKMDAVWGRSASDVWVGGGFDLAHWDGESWTLYPDLMGNAGEVTSITGTADSVFLVATETLAVEGGIFVRGRLHHYDGSSWIAVADLPGTTRAFAAAPDAVFLSGKAGTTYLFHGSRWLPQIPLELGLGAAPAGFLRDGEDLFMAFSFIAFTETGWVYHHDGIGWREPVQVSTDALTGLFRSGGQLYAVGRLGLFHRESPDTWSPVDLATGDELILNAGWSSGSDGRFAVGSALVHNVGEGWVVTDLPDADPQVFLNGVAGSAWDEVFAVGDGGAVYHFDGKVWTAGASGVEVDLHAVWAKSASEAYAVGDDGTALRYDGEAWSPMPAVPVAVDLHALWGTGGGELFATSRQGMVLHFDGSHWSQLEAEGVFDGMVGVSGGDRTIELMATLGSEVTFRRLRRTTEWLAEPASLLNR